MIYITKRQIWAHAPCGLDDVLWRQWIEAGAAAEAAQHAELRRLFDKLGD